MDNNINLILRIFIFTILIGTNVFGQKLPFYLKAFSPEYILPANEFEVSLLLRIFDFNADEIVIHILTADAVDLKGVKLNGTQKPFKINTSGKFKKSFDVKINLKDESIDFESILNFGLILISSNDYKSQIDFKIDYLKNKTIIKSFENKNINADEKLIPSINLNFYYPSNTPGKSLLLKENSDIKFSFNYKKEVSNLLIEFWAKFDKPSSNFISFINGVRKDTIVSLNINKYKVLSLFDNAEATFIKDCFVSKNAWYHFSLFINVEKGTADIYVNNDLAISINNTNMFAENNFEVLFKKNLDGKIEIDQFKVWEFNNTRSLSLLNMNYEYYSADSSRSLLNLSFNDENQIRNFNSATASITYNGIGYKNSTAPIFSRAPELNVYLYNNFYQIEWKNNSRNDAESFELEKSEDGVNFKKIFETFAADRSVKSYNFSDPKDFNNEVIYYRVKQINKNLSQVYSPSLKIGQGEIKLFNLGQNYPNPFNPQTTISIEILETAEVDIYVYDIVGEKVAIISKGVLSQGVHNFSFDGSNLPSGIYFCKAESDKFTDVRKMILAK